MSSQQRVQIYLEKHRISALFEDLRARLIKHLPNEPIPYLMKILQRFDDKSKLLSPPVKRPPGTLDQSGAKGAGWVASLLPGMEEDRGYNRPWTANMKKIRGMGHDVRKPKKVDFGAGTKKHPPSTSEPAGIDDLFAKSQGGDGTGPRKWTTSDDELPSPPPCRVTPSSAAEQEALLLDEEMSPTELLKKCNKRTDQPLQKAAPSGTELKELRQKPGVKAKKHKQALAEMAAAQLKVETLGFIDTGEVAMDPDQGGYEEATDLLEDADELAFEGVTNVKSSGHKVNKSLRRRPLPQADPEVKVAICSKCARLIGDGASTAGGDAYGKFGAFDSMSDVTSGEYGGSTISQTPTISDDDFESASQVVGPRRPVWDDPGKESHTANRNGGGLKSTMTHDSSRELFGDGRHDDPGRSTLVGQAWNTKTYRSHTEVSSRHVVHPDSLLDKGRSWQQLSSDEDSGF